MEPIAECGSCSYPLEKLQPLLGTLHVTADQALEGCLGNFLPGVLIPAPFFPLLASEALSGSASVATFLHLQASFIIVAAAGKTSPSSVAGDLLGHRGGLREENFLEENFELCTYDLLSTNFLPSTQCAALRVTIVFQPCRDSAPQMRPSEAAYAPVTTLTSRGRLGGSKRKKPCFSCHLFTNWWVLLGLSLTAFAVQTSKGALAWGLGEIFDCHQVGFDFRLDRKRVPSLIVLQLLRRCGV